MNKLPVCVLVVGSSEEEIKVAFSRIEHDFPQRYTVNIGSELAEYFSDHVNESISLKEATERCELVAKAASRAFNAFIPLLCFGDTAVVICGFPSTPKQFELFLEEWRGKAKVIVYFIDGISTVRWEQEKDVLKKTLQHGADEFREPGARVANAA